MRAIPTEERRARLGRRHHLARPVESPVEAAGAVVGLHSSDPATVFLSTWARVRPFEVGDLEAALYRDRTLIRIHGMRRTMFVAPLDLAAVIEAACTRTVAATERRRLTKLLTGSVADPDDWYDRLVDRVRRTITADGPSPASRLKAAIPELGLVVGTGDEAFPVISRLLFQMSVEGHIVRAHPAGSWRSSQYHWADPSGWQQLGHPPLSTVEGEDELIRRWLWAFGPASTADVAWWTGWPKGRTKEVLNRIGAVPVELEEGTGWVTAGDVDPAEPSEPWVALLPGLDPTTMGWTERDWYLGGHRQPLFDRNGNAGPTIWVDGRVVGGWAQRADGTVAIRLLEEVGRESSALIEEQAHRLERWLAPHVVIPRFRAPLEMELSR